MGFPTSFRYIGTTDQFSVYRFDNLHQYDVKISNVGLTSHCNWSDKNQNGVVEVDLTTDSSATQLNHVCLHSYYFHRLTSFDFLRHLSAGKDLAIEDRDDFLRRLSAPFNI